MSYLSVKARYITTFIKNLFRWQILHSSCRANSTLGFTPDRLIVSGLNVYSAKQIGIYFEKYSGTSVRKKGAERQLASQRVYMYKTIEVDRSVRI